MTDALTARTWYDDTAIPPARTMALKELSGEVSGDFDVAIVGGGLAGLTLLERLAKTGQRVVLLERATIGAGASGRNGGFCSPGWAAQAHHIQRLVGNKNAAILDTLADEGLGWMKARATAPNWEACLPADGVLSVSLSGQPSAGDTRDENFLGQAALADILSTCRYRHGALSPDAFHFHPLNFMRLLARAALDAGGQILEQTPLLSAPREKHHFRLSLGATKPPLHARALVHATGGYGGGENRFLARRLLAIRTYIGVSEPMEGILDRHIKTTWAIGDTRRAGNYYRRLHDGRLLWGMGITAFGTLRQSAIKAMVMRDIAAVYPEMAQDMRDAGKGMTYGWSGNMAYAPHFLPYVGEIAPDVYTLTGFGGHGMNTAPAAAMALADHLTGRRPEALTPFKAIPLRQSFGPLGRLAAEGVYHARRTLDFLAERAG